MAKASKKYDVPVIGIAGSVTQDNHVVFEHGIDALYSIVPGVITLPEAFEHASVFMQQTARNIAATIKIMK